MAWLLLLCILCLTSSESHRHLPPLSFPETSLFPKVPPNLFLLSYWPFPAMYLHPVYKYLITSYVTGVSGNGGTTELSVSFIEEDNATRHFPVQLQFFGRTQSQTLVEFVPLVYNVLYGLLRK